MKNDVQCHTERKEPGSIISNQQAKFLLPRWCNLIYT